MPSVHHVFATVNVASGTRSQDRVTVDEVGDALLIVLADGAGGMAGGAAAADAFINTRAVWDPRDALESGGRAAVAWIEAIDRALSRSAHGGECTGVVVVVHGDVIAGAGVGDSCACVCSGEGIVDLTEFEQRKPLVGSGRAVAVPFVGRMNGGRLLVASDGLWKYAARERIAAIAGESDVEDAARRLVDMVRLRTGGLQDDVSIALVRR